LLARASNDLFAANGFLSHDVGASVRYEYKLDDVRLVTVKVGAYNGQGESLNDVNDKKSFGARATVGAVRPWRQQATADLLQQFRPAAK